MGTLAAHPSPQKLPISNRTRFKLMGVTGRDCRMASRDFIVHPSSRHAGITQRHCHLAVMLHRATTTALLSGS